MVNTSLLATILAVLVSFTALLYNPVVTRLGIFGVFRSYHGEIKNVHGDGITFFTDTYGCEDLHYYEPANTVFGIGEEKYGSRYKFFPPVAKFDTSEELGQAHFFKVLPEEDQVVRLQFANFSGPFIGHGFDILVDPKDQESLYFIAVNHLPNPAYSALQASPDVPQARSQIEIFHHTVGTLEVRYVRSIRHPLIRTPNDIFIVDEKNFYVTNDHFHRDGGKRALEDIGHENFGAWSDIIHISITNLKSKDATKGFTANVAISDIQNPNGFGHGRTPNEILLGRAASGIFHSLTRHPSSYNLSITQTLQMPSTIDNPSYFHDIYATQTGRDASGLVAAGLAHAATFPDTPHNPTVVYLVQPANGNYTTPLDTWVPKLIFMDDGNILNTAATAVLVPVAPQGAKRKKEAWLFVAGPMAEGIVKTKVVL